MMPSYEGGLGVRQIRRATQKRKEEYEGQRLTDNKKNSHSRPDK